MDVALWEALPPAERAKIEVEKKAEEEKRTAQQAFWEIYVASERESSNWFFGRRLVRGP
mgnify:CR=1 FL=1